MTFLTASLLKASAEMPLARPPLPAYPISPEELQRLMQREGGYDKVITDSGGVTKGGIAQSSGHFTADQIRNLTPQQIDDYWRKQYERFNRLQNPGVRELMFDMHANAGPGYASSILQKAVNGMLPKGQPRLKVDYNAGYGTFEAANGLMQDELAERLLKGYRQHHEQLVKDNPAKYGPNAAGWANRRKALWSSPGITPLHRVTGPPAPQVPTAPVKVKGTPPPGSQIVNQPQPASPPPMVPQTPA